ncbi:MAG: methyltransferase [Acidimicrobiaceae bacterium]|nr:methyltransferase [Acidimicrobiaceae bacterium]MYA75839.1 methyltransferase [Acidimicrobiaceae bacterium]MYD05505.1 methyltransferase [Acidimicrobiaceae bacterium]MYG56472.1 methyltransferase [Acidimicrobiaceae bacterium]MYI57567.1 methyltransferase [Acidimicrobiaceae bacterium]
MRRGGRVTNRNHQPRLATTPAPAGGAYQPLSDGDRDALIDHAFTILEQVGMAGAPSRYAARLKDLGAIERDDGRLLLPRPMVEAALGRAPSSVSLPGFCEDRGITIGREGVHIGTGGAAVLTLEGATGAYRDSTLTDLWTMMRVLDECPNIHYGLRPLVARDVTDELALDLNTAFANTAASSKPTGISFTSAASVGPVVDLFDVALGGEGRFARQPFSMAVVVHVVPPLRFSPEGCQIMASAIERGMIVQTCSAGQAGATSPPSLAGSLAQGVAEVLAGVVLADSIKPGHPCIHAFMPFISDLRSGAMTGGSGEAAVASAAAAQLMATLEIPHAVSAGITESKTADSQAGYEKGYTVALAAHAGADMVQLSVGMLGSIMVASPEILVIDNDMCGAILRSVRGVEVKPDYLNIDIINEAVTGEGHYLGHTQTLELMRSEYVYPQLGDRASVDDWVARGAPSLWSRARDRVDEIVAAGRPGHLSVEAESAIRSRFPILLPEIR